MNNLPKHEELKRELTDKFETSKTYQGGYIKTVITQSDFKELREAPHPPSTIKKGDVIIAKSALKNRPAVVTNVLKDGTCVYIPLTSTDNIHCLTESSSRFFGEGCFTKTFSVCTQEYAIQNFIAVYDNMKLLNKAIKALKEYINQSL